MDEVVADVAMAPERQQERRRGRQWGWVLPVLGGGWLAFVVGTSAFLLQREFGADRARQLWCGAAQCRGLVRPPDNVYGAALAVAAIAFFAALFIVPHRGRLRVARLAILIGLVAASWGAEALLFAPFFFWN